MPKSGRSLERYGFCRRSLRSTASLYVKIFIKDVKSSNGTFINGERLSAEGLESDPFELKTDDIVVGSMLIMTHLFNNDFFRNLVSTSSAKTTRPSFITRLLLELSVFSQNKTWKPRLVLNNSSKVRILRATLLQTIIRTATLPPVRAMPSVSMAIKELLVLNGDPPCNLRGSSAWVEWAAACVLQGKAVLLLIIS
jgi:hypothetical protein